MAKGPNKSQKLFIIISISFSFFLAEIGVGFYTHSLALVADAFHYLNDLIGFIATLAALKVSERDRAPPMLSFGWQRATLLSAFFNGVFLLALGVSIFLQAIQRFVAIEEIQRPRLVMIIGCIGFALNVISATILHEHDHDHDHDHKHAAEDNSQEGMGPRTSTAIEMARLHQNHRHAAPANHAKRGKQHDLGIMGVLVHIVGDALNNIGVIIAGAIIWKVKSPGRFYVDPAVGVAISIMIFMSSLPLVKNSGVILLQSAPKGLDPLDVKHDIEQVRGVVAVHELHIWRLNQQKVVASAHVTIGEDSLSAFMAIANLITECLHAYGIHSVNLQPELISTPNTMDGSNTHKIGNNTSDAQLRRRALSGAACMIGCQNSECKDLSCCD